MHKLKSVKRKLIVTLIFSILAAGVSIVHGIFFDADFSQLQRLSIEGFILTFIILFPTLLFLEWMFDLENHEEFSNLEKRVKKLENKRK